MVPFYRFVTPMGSVFNPATWIVTAAEPRSLGSGPEIKRPVGWLFHPLRAGFDRNIPTSLQKVEEIAFRS